MAKVAKILGLEIVLGLILVLAPGARAQTSPPAQDTSELGDLNAPVKQPPWQVCNQTSYILRVATMITPKGMDTSEARVKGWQKLYPGQ
ncbi:MAG TPA: hypothetical protein ENJ42_03685, partial [Hellea balneolensis]|nr:hypothetical protein [Hellea balneolensis]